MKAAVYENYGPPEVFQVKEVKKPIPRDDEILVRVFATVVTSGDIRLRKAEPFMVRTFNGLLRPMRQILGINFGGKVEKIGKDVKEFRKDDRVFGSTEFAFGCYAEYICLKENKVVSKMPKNMTYEQGAAIPFGALTSLHFLKQANIKKGQKVLIYGASGSLGTAAIQIAKYFGAKVSAVCSTKNVKLVKSLGADNVIDYKKEDFTKNKETYDVIYDAVGKSSFYKTLRKIKQKGIYLDAVHIPPFSFIEDLIAIMYNRKMIGGISIETKENLKCLKTLYEKDKFIPVIDKTYPLDRIADAHRYVETGHKVGNVVITVK